MKNENIEQPITITKKAATRLKNIMKSEEPSTKGIRVAIDTGGCSGMSYNLSFDNKEGEFDKIYEANGIKVVCDIKSWFYVKGTGIDFSDDLLSGGFQLNNPNANKTCGCGTSFSA